MGTEVTGNGTGGESEILHIFGQEAWHDTVVILGNHAGLMGLKKAVDLALENGKAASYTQASDGEGYWLLVLQSGNEDEFPLPYTYEYAKENKEWPGWLKEVLRSLRREANSWKKNQSYFPAKW